MSMTGFRRNRLKERLQAGLPACGASLNSIRDPGAINVLAAAGVDVVFVDLEHNCHSIETAADLIAHIHAAGMTPLVRPPESGVAAATRLLDGGCQSLLFPRLRHPDEVRHILRTVRYFPEGRRGVALVGGAETNYTPVDDVAAAMRWANEQLVVGIVIETPEAVDNLPDMILPGVDLVVVGHGDLAHAHGHPGQPEHPFVVDAHERARQLCRERGVAYGVFRSSPSAVRRELSLGALLVVSGGIFSYIRRGASEAKSAFQSELTG